MDLTIPTASRAPQARHTIHTHAAVMTTTTFTILVRHGNSQRWTDDLGALHGNSHRWTDDLGFYSSVNRWSNKAIADVAIAEMARIWPDAQFLAVPTADLDRYDLVS